MTEPKKPVVKSLYPESKIRNGVDFEAYLNKLLEESGSSVRVTTAKPETQPVEDGTSEIVAIMRPLSSPPGATGRGCRGRLAFSESGRLAGGSLNGTRFVCIGLVKPAPE